MKNQWTKLKFGNAVKTMFFKILDFFYVFGLFLCVDVKNNFKNINNIILIYFEAKNILKINYYQTLKHPYKVYTIEGK